MHKRTRLGIALTGLLVGLAGACGPADPTPEAGPEGHGSYAVLHVERARFDGAMLGERYEHFEIAGRVVRFWGVSREEAARLVGTEDLFEPEEMDSCEAPTAALLDDDAPSDPLDGSDIELIDVGAIDVHAGDRSLVLEPQSFPGLMSILQGAIYGTTGSEGVAWQNGADWTFTARGAGGVGSFEASTEAPDELVVVRIGGDDPTVTTPVIDRALDLPVRWEPGTRDDAVRIEMDWTQLGTEMRLRCATADDGAFTVPAPVLRQIADPSLIRSMRIAVTRERRRAFGAAGLDEGVLLVSLSETFEARVR